MQLVFVSTYLVHDYFRKRGDEFVDISFTKEGGIILSETI